MNANDPTAARRSEIKKQSRRIALVTPWAGGNLGNTTIISAAIANIYGRLPDAEIVAVTLNCEAARRRFSLQAFPLAALSRPYYSQQDPEKAQVQGATKPHQRRELKKWLKQMPVIRWVWSAFRTMWKECSHISASARLVRSMDCIMVPGGGALDEFWGGPWGHPWSLFKWCLISKFYRVPFMFVSVGKSSLERPTSRFFVRMALKFAAYRSYRDPDSKIAVETLSNAENDPVFPDLAFSYPVSTARPSAPGSFGHNGRLQIGISPIAYFDPRSWPRQDSGRYVAYLRELSDVVRWLLEQGHQLLFFTTDTPDIETMADIRKHIGQTLWDTASIKILPGPAEQSIDSHLNAIETADLIIASRLHGVILSHLVGKPVLALSFDPKVNSHMAVMGQEQYCLNIEAMRSAAVIKCFQVLEAARQRESEHLRLAVVQFRQELDSQYNKVLGDLTHGKIALLSATNPRAAENRSCQAFDGSCQHAQEIEKSSGWASSRT